MFLVAFGNNFRGGGQSDFFTSAFGMVFIWYRYASDKVWFRYAFDTLSIRLREAKPR